MKKIVYIILFFLLVISVLGLVVRQVLQLPSHHIIDTSSQKVLQDGYISENQRKIDILHYDLEFDIYQEDKMIIASAELTGVILDQTINSIDLNFYDNFEIQEVLLNDTPADYISEETTLSIPLNEEINDTFLIKISYEGTPQKSGLAGFVFGKRDGYPLIYTLSEPTYASSWFPCNDIPTDKTLLDMKITNDSSLVSVSNGMLVSEDLNGKRKTYHWKTVYPISTYLIALYSSDYEMFGDTYISLDGKDTMSISYYVLPDKLDKAKVDFSEHVAILEFFAKTFGEYPFIKEKYGVAEFLWSSGAMENQTITGVASSLIGGKKLFTDFFVHELAHHWWGNAIGPKSWKDIWLNEGFSSYSEALYFENKGGAGALKSTMRDKYFSTFSGKLSEPGSYLFTSTIYDKGAWVLHMLRWEVGDSTFFKILKEYYNQYKFSNASTSDFVKICENVSDRDLKKFFHQWIDGEGEIELEYEFNAKRDNSNYKTEIRFVQVQDEYKYYEFPIEVLLELEDEETLSKIFRVDSELTLVEIKSDSPVASVKLDPNDWLLATITEK